MEARHYSPELGSFLTKDPAAAIADYAYGAANPVMSLDRAGHVAVDGKVMDGSEDERPVVVVNLEGLAYRWFLGHDLDETPPDRSILSKARGIRKA